jgi:hypothetical protein
VCRLWVDLLTELRPRLISAAHSAVARAAAGSLGRQRLLPGPVPVAAVCVEEAAAYLIIPIYIYNFFLK